MNKLTAFMTAFCVFLLSLIIYSFDERIKALELRCDGRCQYGDTACKAHCDKLGHCPMDR